MNRHLPPFLMRSLVDRDCNLYTETAWFLLASCPFQDTPQEGCCMRTVSVRD
jgi:hypothetical protein